MAVYGEKRLSRDARQDLYQKIAEYDKTISLDIHNVDAYINKGKAFSELGHDEEAVKVYCEAQKHYPNAPTTVAHFDYLLGVAYSNLGRYPEAVTAFDNTINTNKGIVNKPSGRTGRYERDESIRQGVVEAYYHKGNAYSKMRNYPAAVESSEGVIDLGEKKVGTRLYIGAYLHKGKALAEDNNHQEALKAFERVIQLTRRLYAPRPLSVPRARAKAEADGKAIRINKEYSVEAYCCMGRLRNKLGNSQGANEAYKEAENIDQEYAEAIVALMDREDRNRNAETVISNTSSHVASRPPMGGVRIASRMYPEIPSPIEEMQEDKPGPSNTTVIDAVPGPSNTTVIDAVPGPSNTTVIDAVPGPYNTTVIDAVPGPSNTTVIDAVPGPSNTTEHFERAMTLYQEGLEQLNNNPQMAVDSFSKVIELYPYNAKAYYQRGKAFSGLRTIGRLRQIMERQLVSSPILPMLTTRW